jgi:ribosomal protein S18 acetylase RimI-like enzyme
MTLDTRPHSLLTVRPLTAIDRNAMIACFANMSLSDRYQRFEFLVTDSSLQAYVGHALARPGFVIGVFNGDRLDGMAEVVINAHGVGELALTVATARQGRGLGTTLVSAAIAHGAKQNLRALRLSFAAENERLVRIMTALSRAPVAGQAAFETVTVQMASAPNFAGLVVGATIPLRALA